MLEDQILIFSLYKKCTNQTLPVYYCLQVPKADIPKDVLQKKYPQIVSFHLVSSLAGTGIEQLENAIIDATYSESYMGEKVPKVYLNLEDKIVRQVLKID